MTPGDTGSTSARWDPLACRGRRTAALAGERRSGPSWKHSSITNCSRLARKQEQFTTAWIQLGLQRLADAKVRQQHKFVYAEIKAPKCCYGTLLKVR